MRENLALAYVFGLGMVAVFNPCGFAMLPAWIAYFVAADGPDGGRKGVLRALTVGATLTGGFVAVFLVVGLVIQLSANDLVKRLPWLSIVLGVGMVVLAVSLLRGRELKIPNLLGRRGPRSRAHREVFLFGVSYAFVSLACTIPLFLATVTTSLAGGSIGVGILHFVAYACGMGVILTVLTLAVALARGSVVRNMRRVVPHVQRVAAVLLGVAGLYVAYYGWYTLRVYNGDLDPGGPAKLGYEFSARMSEWITTVGPTRIGIAGVGIIAAVAVVSTLSLRAAGVPPSSPSSPQPEGQRGASAGVQDQ